MGWGWGEDVVVMGWAGVGDGRVDGQWAAGNHICGRDWWPKTHFLYSGFTFGAFWESLGGSLGLLDRQWAQIGHHGLTLEHWESLVVPPGCTLGELGSSLTAFGGHLVSLWMPWHPKWMLQVTRLT